MEKPPKRRRREQENDTEPTDREDWIPLMLRLPPTLHTYLKIEASEEFRSLNAQILSILDYHKRLKERLAHER